MQQDCIFCKIINGDIPSATIFENDEYKVILDAFPAAKGHTLILPKTHFENIYDIDGETAGRLFAAATKVARAIKEVTGCEGMNILQNNGTVAGQTVHHFHIHLIPRFEGDGMRFGWKTQRYGQDVYDELKETITKAI